MLSKLILMILLLNFNLVFGQNEELFRISMLETKTELKKAELSFTESSLLPIKAKFERILGIAPKNQKFLVHYYLGYVNWRLGLTMNAYKNDENKDKAKTYYETAQEQLENSIELKDDFAESHLLLCSVYGNRISLNGFLGMILGLKAGREIETAIKLEPKNPRVHLANARNKFFTPSMFGGSIEEALKSYQNGIECFETYKMKDEIYPSWGKDEIHVWYAIALEQEKNYTEAVKHLKIALEINPQNNWVKYELIPKIEQKLSEKK